MLNFIRYVRNRLTERSFWLTIGASIIPAAVLPWPWSAASVGVSVMAALVPDGSIKTQTDKAE